MNSAHHSMTIRILLSNFTTRDTAIEALEWVAQQLREGRDNIYETEETDWTSLMGSGIFMTVNYNYTSESEDVLS